MTQVSDQPPDRFVFSYTEAEIWAHAALMTRRRDRGGAWDRYWTVIFVMLVLVGLAPYAARWLGWIEPAALQPVFTTAYAAFVAGGFTYGAVLFMRGRAMAQSAHRARGSKCWEFAFDDTGFVCRNERIETRVPWSSVERIENTDSMVLIWLDPMQASYLPARLFRDEAERQAFVARWSARAAAAKANG